MSKKLKHLFPSLSIFVLYFCYLYFDDKGFFNLVAVLIWVYFLFYLLAIIFISEVLKKLKNKSNISEYKKFSYYFNIALMLLTSGHLIYSNHIITGMLLIVTTVFNIIIVKQIELK